MLTTVDRVFVKLGLKHPTSDADAAAARDDATQFAAQLLANYQGNLARRPMPEQSSRLNPS